MKNGYDRRKITNKPILTDGLRLLHNPKDPIDSL